MLSDLLVAVTMMSPIASFLALSPSVSWAKAGATNVMGEIAENNSDLANLVFMDINSPSLMLALSNDLLSPLNRDQTVAIQPREP